MRKLLTSLLALAMLVSLLVFPAQAAEDGTGLAVTATVTEKQVALEVIAAREIFSGSFTVGYDAAALTYVSAQSGGTVSTVRAGEGSVSLLFASESSKAVKPGQTVFTVVFDRTKPVLDTEITVTLEDLNSREGLHLALPAVHLDSKLPFTDMPEDSWFHEAVKFCYNEGLFLGVTETLFQPQGSMTRAMFVTTLARMDGVADDPHAKTPFNDVKDGSYYAGAVAWAYKNDIVEGTSRKTFSPDARITREEMVTMLFRYAAYLGMDTDANAKVLKDFPDGNRVNGWAKEAMAWAVEQGIVRGTEKGLEPRATATRAQGAQVLMNFALLEA